LSAWCAALNGILPGVIFLEGEVRLQACQQLAAWPTLVDQYLHDPLISMPRLRSPNIWLALPSHSLSTKCQHRPDRIIDRAPVVPEELMVQLANSDAPVSVSIEDISLAVPDNADRDVYNALSTKLQATWSSFRH